MSTIATTVEITPMDTKPSTHNWDGILKASASLLHVLLTAMHLNPSSAWRRDKLPWGGYRRPYVKGAARELSTRGFFEEYECAC